MSIVQSNSFALKTTRTDGKVVDSYCNYPKSKEIEFIDENTVLIKAPDFRQRNEELLIPILTYKFV